MCLRDAFKAGLYSMSSSKEQYNSFSLVHHGSRWWCDEWPGTCPGILLPLSITTRFSKSKKMANKRSLAREGGLHVLAFSPEWLFCFSLLEVFPRRPMSRSRQIVIHHMGHYNLPPMDSGSVRRKRLICPSRDQHGIANILSGQRSINPVF